MATMATSHQLSVLTNSSVKPPRNPATGLSSSLHERPATISGRFSSVHYDDYDEEKEARREFLDTSGRPKFTADPFAVMRLSNLSDEEFYNKLTQLKNEQRKLLQRCEQMYMEKHQGVIEPTFPFHMYDSNKAQLEQSQHISAENGEHALPPQRPESPKFREERNTPPLSPAHRDFTGSYSKPPTGRFGQTFTPTLAATKWDMPPRPSSAPLIRKRAHSLEELRERAAALQKSFESEDEEEYIPDDTVSEPYKTKDISLALSRIEDMWENFQIEDYMPRWSDRQPRVSSAAVTRKEKKIKEDNWRHRLTVPEPFNMTLREEKKEKRKTKTQIELEELRLKKEMEIDEECSKKFKAAPVPAHVYLPLYDEIMEKAESRRRHTRQMSQELLKSQEKPFNFVKREADKKQHQLIMRQCSQERKDAEKTEFKAKPVPKYIFDRSVDDKLMEEEEYRKIRMKMRSEELLRSASLPPNMEAKQKLQEQMKKEQKMKSKKKAQKSRQRPKINHEVPDYDALYRQFQTELQRRKGQRESTVAYPFRLETRDRIIQNQHKEKFRREMETENVMENRVPKTKPRSLGYLSTSLDSLPSKSTKSADIRSSQIRNRLTELNQREQREIEAERKRRVREMKLRRYLQERIPQETPHESPAEKKKKFREAERARMEDYERELQEMKERVQKRPLLFEQESQTNAKKSAEKKFNATLRSVGLDEDFIESRGSRSASVRDDYTDEYDDDFDDTYVKRDETYTKRPESPMEA